MWENQTEFRPSKNRPLNLMIHAGAAQNQPNVHAPPSLIIGDHVVVADHVRAASCVNPTADLINRAIRPEIKRIVHFCAAAPEGVVERRREAMAYIAALATRLEPERAIWAASLPPMSPACFLRFPLILLLAKKLNYPDLEFVGDLAAGIPIVGMCRATPSPSFEPRVSAAPLTYEE